ncbi:MAG TPA: hypothetical protein VFU35_13235 [Jatrophihabitans sp.]|nr:hypothetical protein [Jatrophihabitans sp.]
MHPIPEAGGRTCEDEQFLALICSDEQLLRAEFDAIIAAEWPSRPPPAPGRGAAAERPARAIRGRAVQRVPGLASRPRHPGIGGWARQRSPPPATTQPVDRKGR